MCRPVSRQSRFSLIFFLQQKPEPQPEPEPEPEPRARIRFRFFLGQNDTVPAVPAPVPQHCLSDNHFDYLAVHFSYSLGSGLFQVSTSSVALTKPRKTTSAYSPPSIEN
jgi:hypothetical protein